MSLKVTRVGDAKLKGSPQSRRWSRRWIVFSGAILLLGVVITRTSRSTPPSPQPSETLSRNESTSVPSVKMHPVALRRSDALPRPRTSQIGKTDVSAEYGLGAVIFSASSVNLTLGVQGLKRDGRIWAGPAAAPELSVTGASYRHPWGREWYAARPEGIEQGFVIDQRAMGTGILRIVMTVGGSKVVEATSEEVVFGSDGPDVLDYHKLLVWDSNGTPLRAWMESTPGELALAIHDRQAAYPIFVDPLIGKKKALAKSSVIQAKRKHTRKTVARMVTRLRSSHSPEQFEARFVSQLNRLGKFGVAAQHLYVEFVVFDQASARTAGGYLTANEDLAAAITAFDQISGPDPGMFDLMEFNFEDITIFQPDINIDIDPGQLLDTLGNFLDLVAATIVVGGWDWGEFGKAVTTRAAAGAVAGAITGGLASSGPGAGPGALVGGLAGAGYGATEYSIEALWDSGKDDDGDGTPNWRDNDIDGDGTRNKDDDDMDGDGVPNDEDSHPRDGSQSIAPWTEWLFGTTEVPAAFGVQPVLLGVNLVIPKN